MLLNFYSHLQSITLKQWFMPFCAFFTTFTIVMSILVLSTDFRNRHYNSSYVWNFERMPQESTSLINLIREDYIKPPLTASNKIKPQIRQRPSVVLMSLIKNKRGGIYIECGADSESDTTWLEKIWDWRGLLTQPHPVEYQQLLSADRKKSFTAQVCISSSTYPTRGLFENSSTSTGETFSLIPCFPLYSLMRAINTTDIDLLILNDVTSHSQILKTLPLTKVRITIIAFVLRPTEETYEEVDDPCCSDSVFKLLTKWGYKRISVCPTADSSCYFYCNSGTYCPSEQS